jgi:hypothetical protein
MLAIGILLLVLGIGVLAYPAISVTDRDKAVDIGPVEVYTEDTDTVQLPRLLGIAGIAAGAVFIVLGSRSSRVA